MNLINRFVYGAMFFVLISGITYAAESKKELALEYLMLSKTKETVDMTIETYVNQISNHNPKADKEKIRQFFNRSMGWEVLEEASIEIVINTYTIQELKDINSFYKTTSGRSIAEKSPKMAADMSNLIAMNIQKTLKSMRTK